MKKIFTATLIATTFSAGGLQASTVNGAATGLASPEVALGFDEVPLTPGQTVTDQFAGFGVTFSPAVSYRNENLPSNQGGYSTRPDFSDGALFNFGSVEGNFTFFDPFSIHFGPAVTDATLAFASNNAAVTYSSLLDGVLVESFTTSGGSNSGFFGFSESLFDEILIDVSNATAGGRGASFDNLSFNPAPVPLPAGLPLMAAVLAVFGGLKWRRSRV